MSDASGPRRALAARLWQYQRERFPLAQHGPFLVVFAGSALCTAWCIAPGRAVPSWGAGAGAFATVLLGFLLMRLADEFKDARTDARHRPHRPVPRGLVTLGELLGLGVGAVLLQAALVLLADVRLLPTLVLWWAFFALTAMEFGFRRWLTRRPLLYMLSHLPSLGLLYLHACAWGDPSGAGLGLSTPLAWALVTAYGAGATFEIARKLRAPAEERRGVETYTAAWGRVRASFGLVLAVGATSASALHVLTLLHAPPGAVLVSGLVLALLACAAATCAWRFVRRPSAPGARALRHAGMAFALVVFLVLGPAALFGVS